MTMTRWMKRLKNANERQKERRFSFIEFDRQLFSVRRAYCQLLRHFIVFNLPMFAAGFGFIVGQSNHTAESVQSISWLVLILHTYYLHLPVDTSKGSRPSSSRPQMSWTSARQEGWIFDWHLGPVEWVGGRIFLERKEKIGFIMDGFLVTKCP